MSFVSSSSAVWTHLLSFMLRRTESAANDSPRDPRPRRFDTTPGLRAELDHLAPQYRLAVHAAADTYWRHKVRYALIGGVAAGAYGQPRATRDVDFLVGDEAFDTVGAVYWDAVDRYAVEYRELYERALNEAVMSDEPHVRIARPEMVAVTKLVGARSHDIAAVVEMMSAGTVDPEELEKIVRPHGKLRLAFARARREYEQGNE